MARTLKLAGVFKSEAEALRRARTEALRVHSTDIRAAGNEVERAVRDYLRRMLAPRYHVTTGHLIDASNVVSAQLDIIIADNFSLPSLLTTSDGTEYIPITSVHAIGEVKSTYYQSKNYYERFHHVLAEISEMDRPLVDNTFRDEPEGSTSLIDMLRGSPNKHLNNLYSFLLCVDGGDFDFAGTRDFLTSVDPGLLPNMTVLLDKGVILYGRYDGKGGVAFHKYPGDVPESEFDWCFAQGSETDGGSLEGAHLAMMYGALTDHLVGSELEPPNAYRYTGQMRSFRRSSLMWAKDRIE